MKGEASCELAASARRGNIEWWREGGRIRIGRGRRGYGVDGLRILAVIFDWR